MNVMINGLLILLYFHQYVQMNSIILLCLRANGSSLPHTCSTLMSYSLWIFLPLKTFTLYMKQVFFFKNIVKDVNLINFAKSSQIHENIC